MPFGIGKSSLEGWVADKLGADREAVDALNTISTRENLGTHGIGVYRKAISMWMNQRDFQTPSSFAQCLTYQSLLAYYQGMDESEIRPQIQTELKLDVSRSVRGQILRSMAKEYGIEPPKKVISDRPGSNPTGKSASDRPLLGSMDAGRSLRHVADKTTSDRPKIRPEDCPTIQAVIKQVSLAPAPKVPSNRPRRQVGSPIPPRPSSPIPARPTSPLPPRDSVRPPVRADSGPVRVERPGLEELQRRMSARPPAKPTSDRPVSSPARRRQPGDRKE